MDQNLQESLASNENKENPLDSRKKLILFGVLPVFISAILAGIFFLMLKSESNTKAPLMSAAGADEQVESAAIPFAELTIPALRSRQYSSTLGVREVAYENPVYTAYFTSYDSDGLKINGLLTVPKTESDTKHPAIIFVHGYIPPAQYQTLERYYDYVDYLARNGFVVFKIDLRGHGSSEGEPGGAYYSADYVIDTLNARAALQSSDFVSPDAIGLWGHSMAGNVTMRSMAVRPEIKAVSIWGGAVYTYRDMHEYGIQDTSYQRPITTSSPRPNSRQRIIEVHGEPKSNSLFWQQMAPTNYLQDLKGAVQLNHATDDDVVTVRYSRDLNSLLDASSVINEFHEYPTGGHNISGASFVTAMENTVAFYKKYLK